MTERRPVEARDISGQWDPQAQPIQHEPDWARLRRLAALTPDDPGWNPAALSLAEVEQLYQQYLQQQQQQR